MRARSSGDFAEKRLLDQRLLILGREHAEALEALAHPAAFPGLHVAPAAHERRDSSRATRARALPAGAVARPGRAAARPKPRTARCRRARWHPRAPRGRPGTCGARLPPSPPSAGTACSAGAGACSPRRRSSGTALALGQALDPLLEGRRRLLEGVLGGLRGRRGAGERAREQEPGERAGEPPSGAGAQPLPTGSSIVELREHVEHLDHGQVLGRRPRSRLRREPRQRDEHEGGRRRRERRRREPATPPGGSAPRRCRGSRGANPPAELRP